LLPDIPPTALKKTKATFSRPARSAKRHMDRVAPPALVLKTQKSDISCVRNFLLQQRLMDISAKTGSDPVMMYLGLKNSPLA
jgi:hypothetical protein